jgi:hypothetical protein
MSSVPAQTQSALAQLRKLYKTDFRTPFYLTVIKNPQNGVRSVFTVLDEIDSVKGVVYRQVAVGQLTGQDNLVMNETDGTTSLLHLDPATGTFELNRNRDGLQIPIIDDKPFIQTAEAVLSSKEERIAILRRYLMMPLGNGQVNINLDIDDEAAAQGPIRVRLNGDDDLADLSSLPDGAGLAAILEENAIARQLAAIRDDVTADAIRDALSLPDGAGLAAIRGENAIARQVAAIRDGVTADAIRDTLSLPNGAGRRNAIRSNKPKVYDINALLKKACR